jgi:hypothetical protein
LSRKVTKSRKQLKSIVQDPVEAGVRIPRHFVERSKTQNFVELQKRNDEEFVGDKFPSKIVYDRLYLRVSYLDEDQIDVDRLEWPDNADNVSEHGDDSGLASDLPYA